MHACKKMTDRWTYVSQHKAKSKEENDREDGEDAGNSDTKKHAQLVLAGCSSVSVCVCECVCVIVMCTCLQVCAQVFVRTMSY